MGLSWEVNTETLYRVTSSKFVEGEKKWLTGGTEETHVKYVGEVRDGVPHGQGVETFKGADYRYEGEYLNGVKDGQGTFTYGSGNKTERHFIPLSYSCYREAARGFGGETGAVYLCCTDLLLFKRLAAVSEHDSKDAFYEIRCYKGRKYHAVDFPII